MSAAPGPLDDARDHARDHGGDLAQAMARYGAGDWLDLSTGINPIAYPLPAIPPLAWERLPEAPQIAALEGAAARFWRAPEGCEVVAAGGASALIAAMPRVLPGASVQIPAPTYNEHQAAFDAAGWPEGRDVLIAVHPNNPDGRLWRAEAFEGRKGVVIDESFADVCAHTQVALASRPGHVVLKSFGKFWGLAGLRLGFAICGPEMARALRQCLGPWAVSGPALAVGQAALADVAWAKKTRARLAADRARLEGMIQGAGRAVVGGTDLFVLIDCDAARLQAHLAERHIWTRVFPYNDRWLRIGLPGRGWDRLAAAFETFP